MDGDQISAAQVGVSKIVVGYNPASYVPPLSGRFAHILKSINQPVRFAIRRTILSGNYALLATMPQRGRNSLRARITGEDQIRNQGRDWSFAANFACRGKGSCINPLRFVPPRDISTSLDLNLPLARSDDE
jgi:hypothetical protein